MQPNLSRWLSPKAGNETLLTPLTNTTPYEKTRFIKIDATFVRFLKARIGASLNSTGKC
jgi:hypothetical protein